jgi:dTDP-4-dehydrorhamnose reductase
MRVVLIGARGQLGTDLVAELDSRVELRALGHDAIDVADGDSVAQAFAAHEPDLVVNTAAYNRVDDAEDHPEIALRTNAVGPHVLARACAAHGSALLHLSTDYVFSGDTGQPWREADPTLPFGQHARART